MQNQDEQKAENIHAVAWYLRELVNDPQMEFKKQEVIEECIKVKKDIEYLINKSEEISEEHMNGYLDFILELDNFIKTFETK